MKISHALFVVPDNPGRNTGKVSDPESISIIISIIKLVSIIIARNTLI